jgi:hypothetical protein
VFIQWAKKLREGSLQNSPTKKERELEKKLSAAERKIGQMSMTIDLLKKLQGESSECKFYIRVTGANSA